jgi:putative heme-binding domain-containing protein
VGSLLRDPELPVVVRERMAQALNESPSREARDLLRDALMQSPYKLQTRIAQMLAGNREGAEMLLSAAELGKVSPRVLQERSVQDRLRNSRASNWSSRVTRLTQGLPPADEALQQQIEARRAAYQPGTARPEQGARLFQQSCAVCHQINQQGSLIGPQLDGIGNRGIERILEDILDPNRNVDHAFRATLLTLQDGETVTGLFRREEGEVLILADGAGKELAIPKSQVRERAESDSSLMPEGLADGMSAQEFNDLLAFLLSQTGGAPKRQ